MQTLLMLITLQASIGLCVFVSFGLSEPPTSKAQLITRFLKSAMWPIVATYMLAIAFYRYWSSLPDTSTPADSAPIAHDPMSRPEEPPRDQL